ncbi:MULTISPECIES: late competence development ComFB family protein [unclassified Roseofilum]|uniref:late competence development ComFB family protein n=1 Tax=unclassified Roseofilum TaxID=2620099 RepID=UPI000E8783D2|nr:MULTISPECIES: late competence development ComFB family protein [unclassified Roseofilum]MBP0009435.1 late competence development ComFB family protein [Roseofilum sp. Belize Diploria]MBP0034945.1 late competence development ComFB family protein [Roseofilum sp. Belize BBD 4]HBR00546.1 competence protein ComFB [Cyanobacteria bacterium UBA11691]
MLHRNSSSPKVYHNVIELLVAEEVQEQLKKVPHNLQPYIEPIEVATYALNRLPALYASSEEGQKRQLKYARQQLQEQITLAVRQGIMAVQRDPIRNSTPLSWIGDDRLEAAQRALEALRLVLNRPDLSWETLVPIVRKALYKAARKQKH